MEMGIRCFRCKNTKPPEAFTWTYRSDICDNCRELARVRNAGNRAEHYGCLDQVSLEIWYEILKSHNFCCASCKAPSDNHEGLTIDHIVPLSLGGLHNKENIQPLCGSCNSKKGDTTNRWRRKELTDFRCTCVHKDEPIQQHWTKCLLKQAHKRRGLI